MAEVTIGQLAPLAPLLPTDVIEAQRADGSGFGKATIEQILSLVPDSVPVWGQITGTLSNQTDLQNALNGKANTGAENTAVWGNITGTLSNQTDLQNALNAKTDQTAFAAHTGDASIHFADAPANGQQYARKDNGWEVVADAGAPTWGQIIGTLSNQTDLQAALNAKADSADLANYLPLTGGTITGALTVQGALTTNSTLVGVRARASGFGSGPSPAFSNTISTNTGIFFPDLGQSVAISTVGIQRFKIDNAGNVTITGTLTVTGNIVSNADVRAFQP